MIIRRNRLRLLGAVALAAVVASACGPASIAPVVTDADRQFDPALVGSWIGDEDSTEYYVITANASRTGYEIVYWDDGKADSFLTAELGMVGRHRVLDIVAVPRDDVGELEEMFTRYVHGFVVIHSVTPAGLSVRVVDPDSLRATLERQPALTPAYLDKDNVLLTGDTPEVRRFLAMYFERPGALGEVGLFPPRKP